MKCQWDMPYIGKKCNDEATITGMCEGHTRHCSGKGCKNTATRGCPAAVSFVCGAPVCDGCYHHSRGHKSRH